MNNYPDGVSVNDFRGQQEWEVDVPITGVATVVVSADSSDEAIEIAKNSAITKSDIDFFDINEDEVFEVTKHN